MYDDPLETTSSHDALTIGTNTASALSLVDQELSLGDVFVQIAGDMMTGSLGINNWLSVGVGTIPVPGESTIILPGQAAAVTFEYAKTGNTGMRVANFFGEYTPTSSGVQSAEGAYYALQTANTAFNITGTLRAFQVSMYHGGTGTLSSMYGADLYVDKILTGVVSTAYGLNAYATGGTNNIGVTGTSLKYTTQAGYISGGEFYATGGSNVSSGTEEVYGVYISIARTGLTGTTTGNFYNLYLNNGSMTTGGAGVTTGYTLYMDAMTGADNNYGLYQGGAGLNVLGDQLTVGGVANRTQLIVKNNASQSGNAVEFQNSSAVIQTNFTFNGGAIFNEQGNDADFRIEGDTATQLLVMDAGLDAVQIGTTTAGAIADFRAAAIVFNETGLATLDFRVEGDTDANLFFVDSSADSVQVGSATTADSAKFYVVGKISTSDELEVNGALNHDGTTYGIYGATPVVQSTGWAITNASALKTLDVSTGTLTDVLRVLGTIVDTLKDNGTLGA
jgi:hypothetical protein